MPQIETLMLIGLGFCLAAFVAVAVIRVGWMAAVQLGQRRSKRDDTGIKPAAELDQDSLKAEYAKLCRKYDLKVEDYKTQIAEHMAELSRERNRADELRSGHDEACERRDTIEGELDGYLQTIATLKSDVAEKDKQTEALENQIAESKKLAKKSAVTGAALREKLNAANSNAKELKAVIATEKGRIAELVEIEAANEKSLGEKATRNTKLEAVITDFKAARAARESEIAELKKTTATLKFDAAEQTKQAQALTKHIADGKKSAKELAGTNSALQNELNAANSSAEALKAEIASLTDELGSARQGNEKLNTTVRQLSDDLTARTRSLGEAKIDVQRIVEEKSAIDDRLGELAGIENERLGTLNRLEQELKQRDEDLARANRDLGELQSAKAGVEQDRDATRQVIDARDDVIKQLESQIADVNSDLETRDAIVVMLRKQIASHGASLDALNEEIAAHRRRNGIETGEPSNGSDAQARRAAKKKAAPAKAATAEATPVSQPLASRIRSLQHIITNP